MQAQQLLKDIEVLPPELQRQVFDFVAFLRKQQARQNPKRRTVGEYAGQIFMSDDFNAHLGDDFWLGEK